MDLNNLNETNNETPMLTLDVEAKKYLDETGKWAKFLAIVGFISLGLIVLQSLVLFFTSSSLGALLPSDEGIDSSLFIIMSLFTVLIAVIIYFPVKYLYNFSMFSKTAVAHNNSDDLTIAMMNLKSLNKFFGIYTIVILSIYALLFFIYIIVASFI